MKNRYLSYLIIFIIFVGLSGCNEVGNDLTNIGDIKANPNNYIGKEVTIEGNCIYGEVKDDLGHSISYGYHQNLVGEYRLTGVIRISETFSNVIIEVNEVEAL